MPALGNEPGKDLEDCARDQIRDHMACNGRRMGGVDREGLVIWGRCLEGSVASTAAEKGEGPAGVKGSLNPKLKL